MIVQCMDGWWCLTRDEIDFPGGRPTLQPHVTWRPFNVLRASVRNAALYLAVIAVNVPGLVFFSFQSFTMCSMGKGRIRLR